MTRFTKTIHNTRTTFATANSKIKQMKYKILKTNKITILK